MAVEMKIETREDGVGINITFTGSNEDPMREDQRLREARSAARKHFKKNAHWLSGGGAFNGGNWELWWSFYPDGYKFPQRTD